MRPTSVPEDLVAEDRVRRTITVPDDLVEHVDPCEALIDRGPDGIAQIHVRLTLDAGDREQLAETGELWVTFLGNIVPFRVHTGGPEGGE